MCGHGPYRFHLGVHGYFIVAFIEYNFVLNMAIKIFPQTRLWYRLFLNMKRDCRYARGRYMIPKANGYGTLISTDGYRFACRSTCRSTPFFIFPVIPSTLRSPVNIHIRGPHLGKQTSHQRATLLHRRPSVKLNLFQIRQLFQDLLHQTPGKSSIKVRRNSESLKHRMRWIALDKDLQCPNTGHFRQAKVLRNFPRLWRCGPARSKDEFNLFYEWSVRRRKAD